MSSRRSHSSAIASSSGSTRLSSKVPSQFISYNSPIKSNSRKRTTTSTGFPSRSSSTSMDINDTPYHNTTMNPADMIGQGTFGTVYRTYCSTTGMTLAIKKVFYNPQYKQRELEMMKRLQEVSHPNIIRLKHHFYTKGSGTKQYAHYSSIPQQQQQHASSSASSSSPSVEVYLHLVMEYMPESLASFIHSSRLMRQQHQQSCSSSQTTTMEEQEGRDRISSNTTTTTTTTTCCIDVFQIRIFMFQLCRGLAHLHALGITHRDLKPQNILIDPHRNLLKICDFGSAKTLTQDEVNVAYICSRYYRSPELILGGRKGLIHYTNAIDIWGAGCILAEMCLGVPLFPGISATDQLIEITSILGTPSMEELHALDPDDKATMQFPQLTGRPLESVLNINDPDFIALIKTMLEYDPSKRIKMINACVHRFFLPLHQQLSSLLENEIVSIDICNFSHEELSMASPETNRLLMELNKVGQWFVH